MSHSVMMKVYTGTSYFYNDGWHRHQQVITWAHYDTEEEAEQAAANIRAGKSKEIINVWTEES